MHLASQDYAAAAEDFRMALTLGTHYTQQCELLLSTCRCALNPRENIRLN
jgi:sigma54-dependent transcription regulator